MGSGTEGVAERRGMVERRPEEVVERRAVVERRG